jgi:DNA-nicking Smr family endonuclease
MLYSHHAIVSAGGNASWANMPRKRSPTSTTPKSKVRVRDPYACSKEAPQETTTSALSPDQFQEPNDDAALFRAAVADVSPLHAEERARTGKAKPAPIPQQRMRDEAEVLDDSLSDHWDPAEMETGDELFHVRDGLPSTTLRRLRRGAFSIAAELDLHGYTLEQARTALTQFLYDAPRRVNCCVRIIHGKGYGSPQGKPVLKNMLNRWLRQRDDVVAFCSALPRHGGTGALYVLLKRRV